MQPTASHSSDDLDRIVETIDRYLDHSPSCNEHDLIKHLKEQAIDPFPDLDLNHSKTLFCAHFLTKHALYTLQSRYLKAERYLLDITSVRVQRLPFSSGSEALARHDTVRDYYLDFRHYFETSEEDVNRMLNDFWQRFLALDDRVEALAALGLPASSNSERIRKAYRRLAQELHPDKGGNPEEFDRITQAKATLDRIYGR